MWEWVVSVGVVVLISTMITIILPDGRLSSLIMVVLSTMVIFVVVEPIFSLNIDDFSFSDNNYTANSSNDNYFDYVEYTYYLRACSLKKECFNLLKNKGYEVLNVEVFYDESDIRQFNIKSVNVVLAKEVINSNDSHIIIIDEIKSVLSTYLLIERNKVNVK